MINRKYADLRHAPSLDPQLVRYDPGARPQSVVRLGPAAARKVKGGIRLGEPGWTWTSFLYADRWYAIVSVFDATGRKVADHVDVARPAEERDGCWSFLDLKLDLILPVAGEGRWVDHDDYAAELDAGTIPPEWESEVARTVDRKSVV